MAGQPEWTVWLLAAAVGALFLGVFGYLLASFFRDGRRLIDTIQNWPQIRRAMVEAEARSGGRYPLWFRLVRVFLILAMVGLLALVLWRRLG